MKKKLLLICLLMFQISTCLLAQSARNVYVPEPGNLYSFFTEDEKNLIDSLKITGNLDARDFRFIRDELIRLKCLDIREIIIVEYEGKYGPLTDEHFTYKANQLPAYSFFAPDDMGKISSDSLMFIPDGGSAHGGIGCYSSIIQVERDENAIIKTGNEIIAVSLKIEHSWVGDLTIKITCPSHNSTYLKKNTWMRELTHFMFFGIPNGGRYFSFYDNREYLNPLKNEVGIPWNYSWSTNEKFKNNYREEIILNSYTYNIDTLIDPYIDGYIVKSVLDSSDYSNRSGFFKPSESFDSLIGCPVNGNWMLEICDIYRNDNGWIAGWSIDIQNQAFEIAKNSLEKIYLPEGLKSIGEKAFNKCVGLKEIILPMSGIPEVENNAFNKLDYSSINIFVPKEFIQSYKIAEGWEKFNIYTIQAEEKLEITYLLSSIQKDIRLYPNPSKGVFYLNSNLKGQDVKVYNINGELLFKTNCSEIDLSSYPDGVYILSVENKMLKLIKQS